MVNLRLTSGNYTICQIFHKTSRWLGNTLGQSRSGYKISLLLMSRKCVYRVQFAKIQTSEKKIFTERNKQLIVGLHKMVVKQDAYTECDMLVYNVVYILRSNVVHTALHPYISSCYTAIRYSEVLHRCISLDREIYHFGSQNNKKWYRDVQLLPNRTPV